MRPFEYVRPGSVEEAIAFLTSHGEDAMPIAGGTAVVSLLNQRLLRPEYVVDLGGLPALKGLSVTDEGLTIGALTPIADLQRSPLVRNGYGLLAEAASQVASIRVRNVATVGGSCCYGEPQADLPGALLASGGEAHIAGITGDRWVGLDEFFRGPYETAVEQGELLLGLRVPRSQKRSGGCHAKFTIGSAANKPVANVSCFLALEGGRVADARIVMGAVGGVPAQAREAAALLLQGQAAESTIQAAAARAADEADPVEDLRGSVAYKRRIVRVLAQRAISSALQRARD